MLVVLGPAVALSLAVAQTEPHQLTVAEYEPRSTLVVPEHPVTRARYPFVDVHNHQWRLHSQAALDSVVRAMDAINMRVMVDLSGGTGEALAADVRHYERYPGRFVVFANLDYTGIDRPGWGERAAARLRRDVEQHGARGLKIFKDLGMEVRDASGRRVPVDDPRLDPVWRTAGMLGIPVLIHTGEPIAFFQPIDRFNERWLELTQFPNRARPPDRYPTWEALMTEQHRVFARHPETTFINAHLGWMGNDLGRLGRLLDTLPNVYVELGAVLYEIGRQPRTARAFFLRYQDRILMGKDSWAPDEYHTYFRVFETADDYIPYYRRRHAFWRLYGLDLPDDVLRKVYYENAVRIIPGLDVADFR